MSTPTLSFIRLSTTAAAAALLVACGGGSESSVAADRADSLEAATAVAGTSIITLPPVRRLNDGGTTTCSNGSIGAVEIDTVYVPDGTSCQLEDTRLKGSIKVGSRATLQANRVRVVGDLQAEGARLVRVYAGSSFGGSVQIKQGRAAHVAGSRITGDLQFDAMTAAVSARGNRLGGSLQAVGNTGGVTLVRNTMNGNLQCKENTPAPTGSGNVAASKEDQCAAL
ncbi:MAG TPA: hypothetical protein VLI72_14475 [Methylibium sp.]|nr:hypothetical protein [Methylibium sp.]